MVFYHRFWASGSIIISRICFRDLGSPGTLALSPLFGTLSFMDRVVLVYSAFTPQKKKENRINDETNFYLLSELEGHARPCYL